eukprot:2817356-Rhodomonas_salina.3
MTDTNIGYAATRPRALPASCLPPLLPPRDRYAPPPRNQTQETAFSVQIVRRMRFLVFDSAVHTPPTPSLVLTFRMLVSSYKPLRDLRYSHSVWFCTASAIPGTNIAYGPKLPRARVLAKSARCLRACYAASGTDIAYGVPRPPRYRRSFPGTSRYAATQCPVLA